MVEYGFGAHGFRAHRVVARVWILLLLLVVVGAQMSNWGKQWSQQKMEEELKNLRAENGKLMDELEHFRKTVEQLQEKLADKRAEEEVNQAFVSWWQWLWGFKVDMKEPVTVLRGCSTFSCCLGLMVDLGLQSAWQVMTDPLAVLKHWAGLTDAVMRSHMPLMTQVFAGILVFAVTNLAVFMLQKFSKLCAKLKSGLSMVWNLPIVMLSGLFLASVLSGLWPQLNHRAKEKKVMERWRVGWKRWKVPYRKLTKLLLIVLRLQK